MSLQLVFLNTFVFVTCIFLLYLAYKERAEEMKLVNFEVKNLGHKETVLEAIRRVSGDKYIKGL